MASVIDATTSVLALAADPAEANRSVGEVSADCVLMEMFGECFWVLVGFAAIQLLIKLNILPEIKFSLFPSAKGRDKLEAKRRALPKSPAAWANADKVPESVDQPHGAELLGATPAARATPPAARAHAAAIREALRARRPTIVLDRVVEMHDAGLEVPERAVAELLPLAAVSGASVAREVFAGLACLPKVPMDAIASALVECLRHEDVASCRALESLALKQAAPVPFGVYEPLVKIYAKADHARASGLFKEMLERGFFASEGLCGSLMARSGEAQNLTFVEEVAAYLRERKMMTLATFKTLMKAYASNGMYEQACDLYQEIVATGIEPDRVMYGCLMKFASRCGRMELSQALFAKTNGVEVQNHLSLMRAAGRDGKTAQALAVLRQAEASQGAGVDVALYNCALDICATDGHMDKANELLDQVSRKGLANRVTYNTLMKGHCVAGDLVAARRVLKDMAAAGVVADSASYNCLMGAVAGDNPEAAFDILSEMDRKGVPIDHYTVSIMMKVAKRARNPHDATRALAVLDRAGALSGCDDEVLVNSVLDACIVRRDLDRLAKVTREFATCKVKPSVHTYGLLIKAHGMLKQPERCQWIWTEMVEKCGLTPTGIALSCMLDSLCCSGHVEQAVALLRKWRERVTPNTVMYSTLIKGFACAGNPGRAMDVYQELRAQGLQMNLVAYTALIDAHARTGKMSQAMNLFQQMQDDKCEPNVITYSAMCKGYCLQGDMKEALRLFSSMVARGLTADVVIFNTLLDGCVKHSHFDLADEVLAAMEEHKVEPSNFTMSIIVKLWGKQRRLDKAFEAVQSRAREPLSRVLDAQVGVSLINACFHNQALERAIEAFESMKSWPGCTEPDAAVYNALVAGLARYGECRKAAEVVAEACEASILRRASMRPLSADCLQQLFKAFQQAGLSRSLGAPLVQKLRLARMYVPEEASAAAAPAPAALRLHECTEAPRLEPAWRRMAPQRGSR